MQEAIKTEPGNILGKAEKSKEVAGKVKRDAHIMLARNMSERVQIRRNNKNP